jgi:DNA-binding CsgD family transcriptional regulator
MTTPQREALPAHPPTFAALAVPNFRRYVSGQSLSLIGTWVETVAQALLVLKLTHSGTVLGLTTAARYAPILLLSPYAGLLVDRYAKRLALLVTQASLGVVSALLGAAVLASTVGLGWCFVVNAVSFGFVIISLLSLDTRRLHPVPPGTPAVPAAGPPEQAAPATGPPQHLPEPLSQAEARVLRLLQTSLSAPEIARELYVSVNTVRTHMRHVYDKLGAHRRLEAINRARALGLLAPVSQRA